MAKTTKTKRPENIAKFQNSNIIKASTKVVKPTGKAASIQKKKTTATKTTAPKTVSTAKKAQPLSISISATIDPVRFGSIGENAYLYLKEGVENLVSEVQVTIAAKELAKKNALKVLQDFEDLPNTCTMSEIRVRLNVVVGALIDVFNAM